MDLGKANLKDHFQQLTAEITRARMALSGPLRKSAKSDVYEIDLQNLLIQKTGEILQTNLQEFQRVKSSVHSRFLHLKFRCRSPRISIKN